MTLALCKTQLPNNLSLFLYIAVDGIWSTWGDWGLCTKTCGGGTETRVRRCDNPAPAYGGKDCIGENAQTRLCAAATCPRKFILKRNLSINWCH